MTSRRRSNKLTPGTALDEAPITPRDGATYTASGNYLSATSVMFVDPTNADLQLVSNAATQPNVIDKVTAPSGVSVDWDGDPRPQGAAAEIGAVEYLGGQPSSAAYVGIDAATQGSWSPTYGADGYNVPGGAAAYPAYAAVAASGQSSYTWAASTADARAPATPSGADRVAACWYAAAAMTIDVNLTDGRAHRVALYALDWDHQARGERVDVLDAATGAVLDTRTISGFGVGTYLRWDLARHVQHRVTLTGGNTAVVSGLFFGPPA